MNTINHSTRGRFSRSGSTLRALFALVSLGAAIGASGCVGGAPADGDKEEAEVAVAEQALGGNIAIGKPATQSSTYTGSPASSAAASLAVDGNTDGNFQDGSVSHTNNDAQAWWQVDLQAIYPIGRVTVWNRTDCCADRLSNYKVMVSTDQVNWTSYSEPNTSPPSRDFSVNMPGRYVRVQLNGTNFLSLAEVQVFPADNLAVGKSAWQTSTYTGSPASSAAASLAVDGNTNGNFQAGSVTATNDEWQPKWTVDLGATYNLSEVRLFNRTDCCSTRLTDFNVIVSPDGVNYYFYPYYGAAPSEVWMPINRTARYVMVQLRGQGTLSLAEVQAFQAY